VTWGKLYSVQPFGNRVLKMSMSGAQIKQVLEQQFQPGKTTILQIAGMRVWMDPSKPAGKRITKVVTDDGRPLDPARMYSVAANNFIADGGDNFTAFPKKGRQDLGDDLTALVKYLGAGKPVPLKPLGRINLSGGSLGHDAH
jgi:5'-nucleotidase